MRNYIEYFYKILRVFTIILYTLMLFFVGANVFCRYVIKYSLTWSEELSRFIFVWLVYLGAVLGLKEKAHVSLTLITSSLTGNLKKSITFLCDFLVISFLLFLGIQGLRISIFVMDETSPATNLNMGWVYIIIPIAAFIMFTQMILNVWDNREKLKRENII